MKPEEIAGAFKPVGEALTRLIESTSENFDKCFSELDTTTQKHWPVEGAWVGEWHAPTDDLQEAFREWMREVRDLIAAGAHNPSEVRSQGKDSRDRFAQHVKRYLNYVADEGPIGRAVRAKPMVTHDDSLDSKPTYADGRNPTFGELFKEQFQPYTDNPAHSPKDKVHGFYNRIQSLVQTAILNASRDYSRWFLPDGKSPLPRQERWEMLRGIRDEHNEHWIEYFENWLEWSEYASNAIRGEFWDARAEIKTFDKIANVPPNPPSVVADDLIREVVKWHRNDGGYWKHCCFSVATDEEAQAALSQLEASDSNYPLDAKSAELLIQELQVERSIVLRHCKTERENSIAAGVVFGSTTVSKVLTAEQRMRAAIEVSLPAIVRRVSDVLMLAERQSSISGLVELAVELQKAAEWFDQWLVEIGPLLTLERDELFEPRAKLQAAIEDANRSVFDALVEPCYGEYLSTNTDYNRRGQIRSSEKLRDIPFRLQVASLLKRLSKPTDDKLENKNTVEPLPQQPSKEFGNLKIEWETKDQIASRLLTAKGSSPSGGHVAKLLEDLPDEATEKLGPYRTSKRRYRVDVAVEFLLNKCKDWKRK